MQSTAERDETLVFFFYFVDYWLVLGKKVIH